MNMTLWACPAPHNIFLPMKTARAGRFATLPIRPFSSGHGWFNQGVQKLAGHELPQHVPVNVHFTFQFGDTKAYPHGKRQRAREAALWAVDPPSYFSEGMCAVLAARDHDLRASSV